MTGDTPPRKSIEVRTLLSFVDYRLVWLNSVPFTPPIQNDSDAQPWCAGNAKLRWRIERDYQELKQEVGLGHFEGRGWRGFHHHATLCIAAYGFLISERAKIPPSASLTTILSRDANRMPPLIWGNSCHQ